MPRVRVTQFVKAPREEAWAFYTDHAGWSSWAGAGKVHLSKTGAPERDGVGCVRVIVNPGVTVEEEVTAFEAPRRMVYRVVGGRMPLKNHEGEVLFEERDGGTFITWSCYFEPTLPATGWVMKHVIAGVFRRILEKMAALARRGRLSPPTR